MLRSKIDKTKPKREYPRPYTAQELHVLHLMIDCFVHDRLGVLLERLHAPSRGSTRVVFARHLWLYLLHAHLRGSTTATAVAAGRDRRMVAHALGRIEARRDEDATFDCLIDVYVIACDRLVRDGLLRLSLQLRSDPPVDATRRPYLHDDTGTRANA